MIEHTPVVPVRGPETGPGGPRSRAERERFVMRELLADPTLVDRAVEVVLGEDESAESCLAVPLGGARVAGQVTVAGWTQARDVLLALDGKQGFPNLRDHDSGDADEPCTIRWGLNPVLSTPDQQAQMWGYHEAGRRAVEDEMNREDSRIPVTPLPDASTGPSVAGGP
ncbi:DUF6302 family protein [Streptomyces sp. NPDC001414]